MKFLLDNMISYRIAQALRALRREVWGLREKFFEDAQDAMWIKVLAGEGGWAFVTLDRRIRSRPHERQVLSMARVTGFFVCPFFLKREEWDQAVWLIRTWPKFEQMAELVPGGTCLSVQQNGKMRFLPQV